MERVSVATDSPSLCRDISMPAGGTLHWKSWRNVSSVFSSEYDCEYCQINYTSLKS